MYFYSKLVNINYVVSGTTPATNCDTAPAHYIYNVLCVAGTMLTLC